MSEEVDEDVWNVEKWTSQLNGLLEQPPDEGDGDAQHVETIRAMYRRILNYFPTNVCRPRRGRSKPSTFAWCRQLSGTAGCS